MFSTVCNVRSLHHNFAVQLVLTLFLPIIRQWNRIKVLCTIDGRKKVVRSQVMFVLSLMRNVSFGWVYSTYSFRLNSMILCVNESMYTRNAWERVITGTNTIDIRSLIDQNDMQAEYEGKGLKRRAFMTFNRVSICWFVTPASIE